MVYLDWWFGCNVRACVSNDRIWSIKIFRSALSRTCIVPGIFNINEPVIFGLPIVLNPILIIPFVITPLVTATIAYAATAMGFVTPTHIMPPWTLPAPIGAYLATGGDWRAIVLVLINIAISFLIYLPFFKMYDKNMLEIEKNGEGESVNP